MSAALSLALQFAAQTSPIPNVWLIRRTHSPDTLPTFVSRKVAKEHRSAGFPAATVIKDIT